MDSPVNAKEKLRIKTGQTETHIPWICLTQGDPQQCTPATYTDPKLYNTPEKESTL